MKDLFEFLDEYGLSTAEAVVDLGNWEARRYRRFCDDLGQLGERDSLKPRKMAGGLTLVPEGLDDARMNLPAMCLYADRLVVPAVAIEAARNHGDRSIAELDVLLPGDSIAPQLAELVRTKPLFERGVAQLARRSTDYDQYSELAQDLLIPMAKSVEVTKIDDHEIGVALGDFQMRLALSRRTPRGAIERLDPSLAGLSLEKVRRALSDPESSLAEALHHALGHIVWEFFSHAELAASVNGHPTWIHAQAWAFLRAALDLRKNPPTAGAGAVGNPVLELLYEVPYVAELDLERVLDLRDEYAPAFDRFRASISAMGRSVGTLQDPETRKEEANRIVREEIKPALADIELQLQSAARQRTSYSSAVIGTALVSVLGALFTGQPMVAGLSAFTIPYLTKALEAGTRAERVRHKPLFFLWQVKAARKRKRASK